MANQLKDAIRFARSVRPHHAKVFAQTVVPEVVRPARVIWNQAIGGLFLVLACPAIFRAVQFFREPQHDERSWFSLALSIAFAIIMIAFGVTSLRRASRAANVRR